MVRLERKLGLMATCGYQTRDGDIDYTSGVFEDFDCDVIHLDVGKKAFLRVRHCEIISLDFFEGAEVYLRG